MKQITIIGSTGMTGETLISLLDKYKHNTAPGFDRLYGRDLIIKHCASDDYADFYENSHVKKFSCDELNSSDIAIFASTNSVSELYVMEALQKVKFVIDSSSVYRLKPNIPMVQFSVNGDQLTGREKLISTPNCIVAAVVDPLYLLHKRYGIKKVTMTTLQSASGAGTGAVKRLCEDTLKITKNLSEYLKRSKKAGILDKYALLASQTEEDALDNKLYAYNILPAIGDIEGDTLASSGEEVKIKNELHYLIDNTFSIEVTALRVPSIIGHVASCNIELIRQPSDLTDIRETLTSPYTKVHGDAQLPGNHKLFYQDDVSHISRIRYENSRNLYCLIAANNLVQGTVINMLRVLNHCIDYI